MFEDWQSPWFQDESLHCFWRSNFDSQRMIDIWLKNHGRGSWIHQKLEWSSMRIKFMVRLSSNFPSIFLWMVLCSNSLSNLSKSNNPSDWIIEQINNWINWTSLTLIYAFSRPSSLFKNSDGNDFNVRIPWIESFAFPFQVLFQVFYIPLSVLKFPQELFEMNVTISSRRDSQVRREQSQVKYCARAQFLMGCVGSEILMSQTQTTPVEERTTWRSFESTKNVIWLRPPKYRERCSHLLIKKVVFSMKMSLNSQNHFNAGLRFWM
jgi:hypothetical protein